jgi:hypothetical protein
VSAIFFHKVWQGFIILVKFFLIVKGFGLSCLGSLLFVCVVTKLKSKPKKKNGISREREREKEKEM